MPQMENLADLLYAHGIRPRHWGPGHTEQIVCPRCHGGKTRETSLTVTIDEDNHGAVWTCHRGSCDFTGGERLFRDTAPHRSPPRVVKAPQPHAEALTSYHPDWFNVLFEHRGIGDRTVKAFGVYAIEDRWFPDPIGQSRCVVFPYYSGGTLVNRKYRPVPAKNPMLQDKDALPTLFNVDRLGPDPAEIVFVEGEMDVLALFECGIPHAASLKDGAGREVRFKPEDKRFEALRTHADLLTKAKKIVLAGDNDQPGLALREELARRLGRHRCWLVTWPDGCKDAGDVLRLHGPDAVLNAMQAAQPYPIEGLYRIRASTLLALRERPAPTVMTTGTLATDEVVKLPTEGRLVVVTGYPSMGKTSWVRYVMIHTADKHDRKWVVFSPEMQPWEQFAADCAETYIGKPFWPGSGFETMSAEEIGKAGEWLEPRIVMMVCDSEDQAPDLDWILERARASVLRDGSTDLLVDPWNEMDHMRPAGMTETDYIGRSLQRLKAFALRYGCNIWLIVHPAKPMGLKTGEKRPPPGPYEISGSANWANKADLGITVHAPDLGGAELHVWKARFRRLGKRGATALMDYNAVNGCYSTPISKQVDRPPTDLYPPYNDNDE